jgi:hypothetical protein
MAVTVQAGEVEPTGFSQIETCWRLSLVKASCVHPPHRSRNRRPAGRRRGQTVRCRRPAAPDQHGLDAVLAAHIVDGSARP